MVIVLIHWLQILSFIYEISENPYEIMHQHKEFFDLSNYPRNSKYYCIDNKKVLGNMKDEYGGKIIYEVNALKSKMYSIQNVNNDEKSIHKGLNFSLMKNLKIHILIKKLLDI